MNFTWRVNEFPWRGKRGVKKFVMHITRVKSSPCQTNEMYFTFYEIFHSTNITLAVTKTSSLKHRLHVFNYPPVDGNKQWKITEFHPSITRRSSMKLTTVVSLHWEHFRTNCRSKFRVQIFWESKENLSK